jgi:hypothetical protein
MRKLLPYLLIIFVALFGWYYKGMPVQIKKAFGKVLAVTIMILWIYLLLRHG